MRSSRRKYRMFKLRQRPPYTGAGKTTLPETQNKSGIYIIRENGKIVYVGYSGNNLYRTMYRHFQAWNHSQQEVVTYHRKMKRDKYTIAVTLCAPKLAEKLEKSLVIKHQPRDNANKYKFYQTSLAEIEAFQAWEEIPVIADSEVPF
jgi:hypothetical protein